jgi:hypothetical protein
MMDNPATCVFDCPPKFFKLKLPCQPLLLSGKFLPGIAQMKNKGDGNLGNSYKIVAVCGT